MSEQKILYNRREAAHLLSISLRTLDSLIAGKILPARRLGRRVLVSADTLSAFGKETFRVAGSQAARIALSEESQ